MIKPIYVLGTGLSHDGSSCLLKDGKLIVAIEKERISRKKHDGGNDSLTVEYCLNAAGITVDDLSLVVQCANFEKETIRKDIYQGKRLFDVDCAVPFVTISHHLAHAWSAVGTSPFDECNVMVIDGCGSFFNQCDDLEHAIIPADINREPGIYAEKDSFYFFDGKQMKPLYKDFSPIHFRYRPEKISLPTTIHSIGGLYAMAANYCFGSFEDAGKLMGLAPFGIKDTYTDALFVLEDGRVFVDEKILSRHFTKPANDSSRPFKEHFQYYADIARWVQDEAEKAILYIFEKRLSLNPHSNMCYAGGVALNAVGNTKILQQTAVDNFYIEPAAGDNGLALGCAFYGLIHVLQHGKIKNHGSTFLGKVYTEEELNEALKKIKLLQKEQSITCSKDHDFLNITAKLLSEGKTIGWFQWGAEFGPRALGRRSILADPRIKDIQERINIRIKLREDFRPFAPAVLYEDKDVYFQFGLESPYMILIDKIKEEWKNKMPGIVHTDGTCRVQTVSDNQEPFYKLLQVWKKQTGISVLLNTSFNKKGMPIVETPGDAIDFFLESELDVLVMNDHIICKQSS